jgi:hypothetical protein
MNVIALHRKLRDDLIKLINEFENETGFKVNELRLVRGGSSDIEPFKIWGIYMPITPKGE